MGPLPEMIRLTRLKLTVPDPIGYWAWVFDDGWVKFDPIQSWSVSDWALTRPNPPDKQPYCLFPF